MNKSFFNCSRSEIEQLCSAVMSSFDHTVPPAGWSKPRIEDGKIIISFDAHPDYHWWKLDGKSIEQMLIELSAPYEVAKCYLERLTEAEWTDKIIPF
jgi:hypothetical protein